MNFENPTIGKQETLSHTEERDAILVMAEADQEMRRAVQSGESAFDSELDRSHTDAMKTIVDRIGWPTVSKVGVEAAKMAWLLVQHADHDPDFQRRCLDLMRASGPEEVDMEDVAYLEDRVLVAEGKPQRYGTQFGESEDGSFGPAPIEDPEHLDERRAEAGMGPFAEYEASMRKIQDEWEGKKS